MSKLKVTTIADPDNDNTAISIDTSGNITIPNNATFSGTLSGDGSGLTGISGGKVLQVVQSVLTSTPTNSTGSWDDTGLNVNITPTDATSKMLIMASVICGASGSNGKVGFRIYENTDGSIIEGNAGDGTEVAWGVYIRHDTDVENHNFVYLDDHNTTSQRQYYVQYIDIFENAIINTIWDNTNTSNTMRGSSTLTVMEISTS